MIEFVKSYIAAHKLLNNKDTVLIAVSGGPDSIALLHVLWSLKREYNLELHAAHLNHMFRGDEARADADFVRAFCQELKIPCTIAEEDVPAFIAKTSMSAEEAARHIRYRFFAKISSEIRATKIALGHHADDQAETILLNLLRGSGMKGLAGMKAKRGPYIRPLLGVTRAQIEQYLKKHELPSRVDSTNLEPIYTRNQIRLELIPLLKEKYNPNLANNLNQMAEILRVEDDFIEKITKEAFKAHVKVDVNELSISRKVLLELPLAIRRRLFRLMFQTLTKNKSDMTFKTVIMMEKFVNGENYNKNLGLPQELVLKSKPGIIILSNPKSFAKPKDFSIVLEVPGCITLPNKDKLSAQILLKPESWQNYKKAAVSEAYLDLDLVKTPLKIRSRKPGDSFYPLGLKRKKKVKDFFIDQKVPWFLRDSVPIVTDATDRILWVGGYRVDDRFKISSFTKRVLHLAIEKADDSSV